VRDALASPGIDHVDLSVIGLDDRWVGVFPGLRLERVDGFPGTTVGGVGNDQRGSFAGRVVVNQQVPPAD
jgi:hypothetical protein